MLYYSNDPRITKLLKEVDCVSKDYQIQALKDRLRVARDTIQSLRNRIKRMRKTGVK